MKITTTSNNETFARSFGLVTQPGSRNAGRLARHALLVLLVVFGITACGGGAKTGTSAGGDGGGTSPIGGPGVTPVVPGTPPPPPPPGGVSPAEQASIDFFTNNVLLPAGGSSPIATTSGNPFLGMRAYCGPACHEPNGSGPPKFATLDGPSSHGAAVAYSDFVTPASSPMVIKLPNNTHNCWVPSSNPPVRSLNPADCAANAADMADIIQAWADFRAASGLQLQVLASQPARLGGSARYDSNIIAKYEFNEGTGNTVFDTSGVTPAIDLTISNMEWGNGGLSNVNDGGKAEAPANTSVKLNDMIAGNGGSGEYTIEAWLTPAAGNQNGPARTISYSIDTGNRNFTFGQTNQEWIFRNRQANTNNNGNPLVQAAAGSVDQNGTMQHVVMTYSQAAGRKIFINGVETTYQANGDNGGDALNNWNNNYRFVVGNEVTNNRTWKGTFRFVAIFNQELTTAQIQTNYSAGPTGGSTIQFDISALTNVPNSFVQFKVGEIDSNAYVFTNPEFIVGAAGSGNTQSGDQLYAANCATCHNARALTTVDNPSLASIQNAMGTIPNMVNSVALQALQTAELQLISDYLLDGQALYQTSCASAGCHANLAVNDTSLAGIKQAIAQNRGGMAVVTLLDVKLQAISDYLITGNAGGGANVAAPVAAAPLATPFDLGFMRIAVNGQVPGIGQTYGNMYTTVSNTKQSLSPLGAVIKQGLGAAVDEFHLEFGLVGNTDVRVAEPLVPPPPLDTVTFDPYTDSGIRNFAQIRDTMAAVTGVDTQDNAVRDLYQGGNGQQGLTQQLPESSDLNSFVPAQQVGVIKLAIEYCDRMFDNGTYRSNFFGGIDPYNQNNRDATLGLMIDKMVGTNITTQPAKAMLMADLTALLDGDPNHLNSNNQAQPIAGICRPGNCNNTQYQAAMRVSCMAILSNATNLIY